MSAQHLLSRLTDQPRPAQELAEALQTTLEQVQTWAQQLRAEGVPLLATTAGYALQPGTPAPALVRPAGLLGQRMRYAGRVGSTQDEIRRWADDPHDPAPHGAVWVAEQQTAGRGRRGRNWDTTHGTLVFSVLLRPQGMPPQQVSLLPLAVGVALHQAAGVGGLKWPNDLLAPDGRKLAGILLEADFRGNTLRRAVLGIGVNVSAAPPAAACLTQWRPELTRAQLLSETLSALDCWLSAPRGEVLQAWRERNYTLGQRALIQGEAGQVAGVAVDIDEAGGLLVQGDDGKQRVVSAGEVQLVGRW